MRCATSLIILMVIFGVMASAQPRGGRQQVGRPIGGGPPQEPKIGVLIVDMNDGPGPKLMNDMRSKGDMVDLTLPQRDLKEMGAIIERAIKAKAAELQGGGGPIGNRNLETNRNRGGVAGGYTHQRIRNNLPPPRWEYRPTKPFF